MDQKLHHLLHSLPSRTAWIIIGSCAAFWLICFTGVLTPPVSAPPNVALFWFYAMLMLALASAMAAIGAAAVLLVRQQQIPAPVGAQQAPAESDDAGPDQDAEQDQLAGLGRMLDGPDGLLTADSTERPVPPQKIPKAPKRRPRERR